MQPDRPLLTYLNDHRSGAAAALVLLNRLERRFPDGELSRFFGRLRLDVRDDSETLEDLYRHLSTGGGFRRAAGRLAGSLSRVKLDAVAQDHRALALFQSLEVLSLGILGKRSLWRALRRVAPIDGRLSRWDFAVLESRADEQADRVERLRAAVTLAALHPEPSGFDLSRRAHQEG